MMDLTSSRSFFPRVDRAKGSPHFCLSQFHNIVISLDGFWNSSTDLLQTLQSCSDLWAQTGEMGCSTRKPICPEESFRDQSHPSFRKMFDMFYKYWDVNTWSCLQNWSFPFSIFKGSTSCVVGRLVPHSSFQSSRSHRAEGRTSVS